MRSIGSISVAAALRAMAVLLLAVKMARVALASHSYIFFCWYYFDFLVAPFQAVRINQMLRSRRFVWLAPRKHGKSENSGKYVPLWLIVKNRQIRILIVTAAGGAKGLAARHVMVARHELRNNQRLIRDFGKFYDPRLCDIWQQEAIEVIRKKKTKDPTLEATGIFGSVTGGRFDVIIFDDVIDLKKVNTIEQIHKIKDEVMRTYLPLLVPDGRAWMIGTVKAFGDIYQDRIKNPQWNSAVDRAIIREPDHEIIKLDRPIEREDGTLQEWEVRFRSEDRGEVLCPELMSIEQLLLERVDLGTRFFNSEYQNIIVDDETAKFPLAHLQQCRDETLSFVPGVIPDEFHKRYLYIIHSVDPALAIDKKEAEAQEDSYFVQFAVGLLPNLTRHILGLDRFRGGSPDAKEERIKAFYRRFNPYRCVIEKNAFGVIHAHNLIAGTDMKIVRHQTDINKNDPYEGIPHLSAQFECLNYRFPYATDEDKQRTEEMIEEFHQFPLGIYQDQVMALWIAEYYILRILKGQARLRKLQQKQTAA